MGNSSLMLLVWFVLTVGSVLYMAYDLFTRTPEMKVMKWGWLLVALYTGPVALILYVLSCRKLAAETHDRFVAPLWKQSVGSTIHCLAGDATGIILAASVTLTLGLPMGVDSAIEYVSGFAFGLLIFQSLFMKDMLGGSYLHAIKKTWLAEWLSMNAVMAGMIPTMIILMSRNMNRMDPTSVRFWAVMSLATLVGAVLAYPINWWLVKNGLKHGMGTEQALGSGGESVALLGGSMHMGSQQTAPQLRTSMSPSRGMPGMAHDSPPVSRIRLSLVAGLTFAMLGIGIALAARFGDFSIKHHTAGSMAMADHSKK
ncbi:MAG: DUF4396 domain-containing protein [Acidobacteriaceae bacterium]